MLFAAAGPLATDDLWWHVTLGRSYLEAGPWLTQDPRLHTAIDAPAPSAWLFDVVLAAMDRSFGLSGLRAFHLLLVAGITGLAWQVLRREISSRPLAGFGCGLFIACASYRLLQLRPSLMSIAACLALYLILSASPRLRLRDSAAAVLLCGLWANLHAGFLLGPLLILSSAIAEGIAGALKARQSDPRRQHLARAARLALTGAFGLTATLINPIGMGAHRGYLSAGFDAVHRGVIADEWRGVDLFSWPLPNLPPTPLPWLCLWILLPLTLYVLTRAVMGHLRGAMSPEQALSSPRGLFGFDPTLLTFVLAAGVAPFLAVRFLWMLIFPVALSLAWLDGGRPASTRSTRSVFALALLTWALLGAYVAASDWTLLAPRLDKARYSKAYSPERYFAHSVWFLADSGVEGNLYNAYFTGGFLEYWLGPKLRTFVDGSLNFPAEVFDDYLTLQSHGALRADGPASETGPQSTHRTPSSESVTALLDRHEIDLFIGIGLPIEPRPGRPWRYTTSHLERESEWILVFRSLRSSVYLRRGERNASNLDRIVAYYGAAGVPFDRERGLDVVRVLEENTSWAIDHGMGPADFQGLVLAARSPSPRTARVARERLASTWAALGAYERALAVDGSTQTPYSISPADVPRQRRGLWSLIRLDRPVEALERAEAIAAFPSVDRISRKLVASARDYAAARTPQERARIAALAIAFSPREGGALAGAQQKAPARSSASDTRAGSTTKAGSIPR